VNCDTRRERTVFHRASHRIRPFQSGILAYEFFAASLIFLFVVLGTTGGIGAAWAVAAVAAILLATGLVSGLLYRHREAIERSMSWPYTRLAEYIPLRLRVAYWAVAGAGAALGGLIAYTFV
jgi:hypothetical protein